MAKMKKNHHLEKRNDTWHFRGMVNGKRYFKALSSSVTEARRMRDSFLKETLLSGEPFETHTEDERKDHGDELLFGQAAIEWADLQLNRIKKDQIKESTWRDWKSSMNGQILPFFGNTPITNVDIAYVERFISSLNCGPKRVNNILVPLRAVMKYAKRHKYIHENPMDEIVNLKLNPVDILPLTIEEVRLFLSLVLAHYESFFTVAFFTGMRFGEMAALKWSNVDFDRGVIKVRESRVYGKEGRTKTSKSKRDIDMLPPVKKALESLRKKKCKDKYVFRDQKGALLTTDHIREVIWKPTLSKANLEYRPPIQTRHTFATLMIDAGEDIGWVQRMMGHGSLQMIMSRYYSWVKKSTRSDGSAFMRNVYSQEGVQELLQGK